MIDKNSDIPFYRQVKHWLREQISAGYYAPQTAIPSELDMSEMLHVSRATIRQAVNELVQEKLVYIDRGRGTFVCEPRMQHALPTKLISFSEELQRHGKQPGGMLLKKELVQGTLPVREQLRLTDDEEVIRLERLRTADGTPVAYEVAYLPSPRADKVYERAQETADGSLYRLMLSIGLVPYLVQCRWKCESPGKQEAPFFPTTRSMRKVCVTFDPIGIPILSTETFYHSSYELEITLLA